MKKVLTSLCFMMLSLMLTAQTSIRERIEATPAMAAGNCYAYPGPETQLTKAPKGFKPFYISHYGRHGSRWLIQEAEYLEPQKTLHQQDSLGNLTALGKDLMRRIDIICKQMRYNLGQLTPLGAQQHEQIAVRMYANFPEVFRGNAKIDALSTAVPRCILSMAASTAALKGCNPGLQISRDCGSDIMVDRDLLYLNSNVVSKSYTKVRREFADKHTHPSRFMSTVFVNPDAVDVAIYRQLLKIAGNMQDVPSEVSLMDLFTTEELYDEYLIGNVGWYLGYGFAAQSGGQRPYRESLLLRHIIDDADAAIAGNGLVANLRYGHDSILIPLVSLMCVNGKNYSTDDLENLHKHWNMVDISPMAGNLQMIFYRNKLGSVLVKLLLNENEATLPIGAVEGPYYKWEDVKAFWEGVLLESPVFNPVVVNEAA